ncbi:uncharacterized protein PHALS_03355 [Plasmopara halstedii]|uniref:Uncharacterized protein n=1 Tax=Plasmopara halstedii TaxID=4781 RepID=A0A0P1A7R7_PLAHL|nr:uncharacterized protein PHALS_03355 [Plasmopara halstedii]CEG36687.1 hypothetical protein PHALS_03355 [Plasmopara halstedii]|eukprot:XP_024573056.1 hypothetical protein PHALS_03355 [Plasmopara halstedii]
MVTSNQARSVYLSRVPTAYLNPTLRALKRSATVKVKSRPTFVVQLPPAPKQRSGSESLAQHLSRRSAPQLRDSTREYAVFRIKRTCSRIYSR